MSASLDEVGTASRGKADEGEGTLSGVGPFSQADRMRPIGMKRNLCQRRTVEDAERKTNKQLKVNIIDHELNLACRSATGDKTHKLTQTWTMLLAPMTKID